MAVREDAEEDELEDVALPDDRALDLRENLARPLRDLLDADRGRLDRNRPRQSSSSASIARRTSAREGPGAWW